MTNQPKNEIGVTVWNILYDHGDFFGVGPQIKRTGSHVRTLRELPVPLDIVGLVEVEHSTEDGHLGEYIAEHTVGGEGIWAEHSRPNEHIGLFGRSITQAKVHGLDGNRKMIVSNVSGIDVALVHLTFGLRGDKLRKRQTEQVIDVLANSDRTIIMGDFNSASWQKSRKLLEEAGFISVFSALGRRRPPTIVAPGYRKNLPLRYQIATRPGFSPDDIYVRGVNVLGAGVFDGDSDHRGVWARLSR